MSAAAKRIFEPSAPSADSSTFEPPVIPRIIPFDDVCNALRKTRPTIYNMIKNDPKFPRPVRVGRFCTGFYEHEISFYLHNLPRAADAPVHHGGKVHLHKKQQQKAATQVA